MAAQQLVHNMDDKLYNAARVIGAAIPPQINFLSRTMGDRNSALHVAAQYGNLGFIREALDQDNEQNYQHIFHQNCKGETLLHHAVQFGHSDIVMVLLNTIIRHNAAQGVDHQRRICWIVTDNQGDTPLHKALIHGHDDIAMTLLAFSLQDDTYIAMISAVNRRGKTIVHYAVEENKFSMVKNCLENQSSLAYVRDNKGMTPLHIAFEKGLFSMVEIILKTSPQSVEIRDNHGRAPLHYAKMDRVFLEKCRTSIDERILHLLINMVDKNGNTPLHLALIKSEQNVAYQLLLFNGCNKRLGNKQGNTPWDLCKSNKKIPYTSLVHTTLRRDSAPQNSSHSTMFLEDEEDVKNWLDKIAVAAALLLPLNFAAAFSVPGGYDNVNGKPIFRNQHTFHTYSIANMLAFLATVFILISCTFGIGKRVKKRQLARVNIFLLQVALFTTVIAYVAGIFVVSDIGQDYKYRVPTVLLFLGVGIVSSLLVINWFN